MAKYMLPQDHIVTFCAFKIFLHATVIQIEFVTFKHTLCIILPHLLHTQIVNEVSKGQR